MYHLLDYLSVTLHSTDAHFFSIVSRGVMAASIIISRMMRATRLETHSFDPPVIGMRILQKVSIDTHLARIHSTEDYLEFTNSSQAL